MSRLWVVVLAGTCACQSAVDLTKGRGYACSRDAGEDAGQCGQDWICGLEGTCHDPKVLADYQCTADSQCSGDWRCGFGGRCLDPSGEALGTKDAPADGIVALAPKFSTQLPTAGMFGFEPGGFTYRRDLDLATWAVDGGLFSYDGGLADAGSVVLAGGLVYLLGENFSSLDFRTGAWATLTHPDGSPIQTEGAQLRRLQSGGDVALFRNGDAGGVYTVVTSRLASDEVAGLPKETAILDLASVGPCAVAATSTGIQTASWLSAWSPLRLEGFEASGCGGVRPITYQDLSVRSSPPLVAVAGRERRTTALPDGGVEQNPQLIALFEVSAFGVPDEDGGKATDPCVALGSAASSCDDRRWLVRLGSCPACSPGEELVDFHPVLDAQGVAAQVECATAYGSSFDLLRPGPSGSCTRSAIAGPSSLFRDALSPAGSSTNTGMFGKAGAHGQIWLGKSALDATPLFLDRLPTALAYDELTQSAIPVAGNLLGYLDANLGIPVVALPLQTQFTAGVAGVSPLLVTADGVVVRFLSSGVEPVAFVDAAPTDLREPFRAALATTPDGGYELIVSSFDTLYSAVADKVFLRLTSKLKPLPGSAIDSIAAFVEESPDAGRALAAWVLTRNGLFHVRAETEKRWRAADIPLPEGDPLKVWTEGTRGRVGYSDGVVLSLPSRVPLASALPIGAACWDFLYACGQNYAVSELGLFRLAPSDGGVVDWVHEEVGSGDFSQGGRLFELGGEIFVFSSFGEALKFTPVGGCN